AAVVGAVLEQPSAATGGEHSEGDQDWAARHRGLHRGEERSMVTRAARLTAGLPPRPASGRAIIAGNADARGKPWPSRRPVAAPPSARATRPSASSSSRAG